jgi:hypothetical protein
MGMPARRDLRGDIESEGPVPADSYIYASIGGEVLRLPVDGDDLPLPGGDCPTTRSVGALAVASVEIDDAGSGVLIALDPAGRAAADQALAEGWERPTGDDPWVARVDQANGRSHTRQSRR